MHDRTTVTTNASDEQPGCDECLLSPECPASAPGGMLGERDIKVVVRILRRGDRLFDRGERFDSIYMVRSGTIKTSNVSASGEEQVIGFHTAGDLVGLDAIGTHRHLSGAIALETSSVCCLPYEPLCRLSARIPQVQSRLLAKMSRRIRDDGRRLDRLSMRGASQRIASFLVGLLDSRCSRGLKSDEILLPMPRADIASYLVLAVETVSRSLSRQHEAGVIDVRRKRIRILDEPRLRAVAGEADQSAAR